MLPNHYHIKMSLTAKEYKQLLQDIKTKGLDSSFRKLYYESYERLFRTAYYFTQNDELAREVSLDVLADVWDRRNSMVIPDDWERWSFIVTKNRALNTIEKESKRRSSADVNDIVVSQDITPSDIIEASEAQEIYERIVWGLSERCREAWILVREEGLSHAEAAKRMGTSEKTVDAQITKALRALREALLCMAYILLS
ncbi:MAG: sigma-70 family RNA polymerase sigma factor [Bacteroidia bacterium]|nr:sigma-70 family RNA polymerase sigma factor [Bacteroidia bacterium]